MVVKHIREVFGATSYPCRMRLLRTWCWPGMSVYWVVDDVESGVDQLTAPKAVRAIWVISREAIWYEPSRWRVHRCRCQSAMPCGCWTAQKFPVGAWWVHIILASVGKWLFLWSAIISKLNVPWIGIGRVKSVDKTSTRSHCFQTPTSQLLALSHALPTIDGLECFCKNKTYQLGLFGSNWDKQFQNYIRYFTGTRRSGKEGHLIHLEMFQSYHTVSK
jgi:hypothetical protein